MRDEQLDTISTDRSESYSAVVPAAGIGRRFGADLPKQYLHIDGRTVLEHSVARLLALPALRRLVLVVAAGDSRWRTLPLLKDERIAIVPGGAQRADSVQAGLEALRGELADDAWVLVHDVARPCLPAEDLRRLLAELAGDPVGGLLAAPVSDTVKQVLDGRVQTSLDRRRIWRALTPQLFRYGLLRDALAAAAAAGVEITDEASAVEYAGHAPKVVIGSACNIKITEPADLELADFYIQRERRRPAPLERGEPG